jgi:HSP20 family protein
MVLQRLYPISATRRISPFEGFWRAFGSRPYTYESGYSKLLPLDIDENEDTIKVSASVPGVDAENIEVTVDDGVLTIKAETAIENEEKDDNYVIRERRYGSLHRSIQLPDTVNADNAESTYEQGVLTITLPKTEAAKPKSLPITVKS